MIKFGSTVKMHYAISNLDGVKFESTFDKEPITFTVGKGVLPQKLEVPLYGLNANEEQTIRLSPKDAFGLREVNGHTEEIPSPIVEMAMEHQHQDSLNGFAATLV